MVVGSKVRKSGKTGAFEAGEKAGQELADTAEEELPEDREKTLSSLTFSRMKIDFSGPDKDMVKRIKDMIDGKVLSMFQDAFAVMSDIYDVVREPARDLAGDPELDRFGFIVWQRSVSGAYLEDWSRLTYKQREDFLFRITTSLFEWQQRKADLWAEAMYAKAIFTEHHALAYDSPVSGTIEDRTAYANTKASEHKYFALYCSHLSKRADAVVNSLELLGQRLKDTLAT